MAIAGTKAQEASFGQYGTIFVDTVGAVAPPTGYIIVAISMLDDTKFAALTVENGVAGTDNNFANTVSAAHNSGTGSETELEGSGGDTIANTNVFPKGFTLFGRYTGFTLNAAQTTGGVIAYIAPR